MLSVGGSDKKLECVDCKTCFTSASLLLKHFAEHVIDQALETKIGFHNKNANVSPNRKSKMSLLQAKKKGRKESILEAVLRQSTIQNEFNGKVTPPSNLHSDMSLNSNTSSSDAFNLSRNQNSVNGILVSNSEKSAKSSISDKMVFEIGQRAKEKHKCLSDMSIVKFDLQKRLENCVSRLASRQGNKETEISINSNKSIKPTKATPIKNNNILPMRKEVTKECDGRDEKPLNCCIVTYEECLDKEDKTVQNALQEQFISKPIKGSSNRKQLMPKKIHRPKEDSAKTEVLKTDNLPFFDSKICQKLPAKRKYLCQVCSKSFGWSTDLKRHMLTHTGERPFKCQMCDATFTRNFLLQKHESRVHSLDNVINVCDQDDSGEPIKLTTNNSNGKAEVKRQLFMNGKKRQNKVLKNNKMMGNSSKGSLALNLVKTVKTCDKFSPSKRKLQCEESFDHFPQKVFNIL